MGKRLGIDIDGTVTSPSSLIPFINNKFNLKLTLDDIKEYDLTSVVDVPVQEFAKWFTDNEAVIYEGSPLAEGVKRVLNLWQNNDHELFFISARPAYLLEKTKNWFMEKGLSFHHIELIGTHDKVAAAKKHGVEIFFEDKHDNAVSIHEECKIPVILFNTPYNQDPVPKGVIRVDNWEQAYDWVQQWIHRV